MSLLLLFPSVSAGGFSLDGTGSQITLTGGTATLSYTANVSLTGTGSALALTGGTATLSYTANVSLDGTGAALVLTGGTAGMTVGGNVSLVGTGSTLALVGGTATLSYTNHIWLEGTGTVLTLTGAEADFTVTGIAPTEESPSGGWAAYNYAQLERNRRKRKKLQDELEEEADRLEALLIAEKALPPNEELEVRIKVREYADFVTSRRTQRAIDYALRAKTALAYQLAAREIARELEDEEHAVLLTLAML